MEVPLIHQERERDCGLAVLTMMLRHHGMESSVGALAEEIAVDEVGTYAPQLGFYLISKGFAVRIITLHPKLFTLKDKDISSEQMKKRIQDIADSKMKGYFLDFLEKGGEITPAIPTPSHVREEILAGRPVIALLTTNFLRGKEPKLNYHYNIITGIDGTRISVNDPLTDERGGKQEYRIDDFFYGLYASIAGDLDNGCLILARKKEKNPC